MSDTGYNLPTMPTQKPFPRKRSLHDCAYLTCEATSRGLLLEFKIHVRQPFLLFKDPLLWRQLSEKRNILEENLNDFFVVVQAVFSQSNLAVEDSWCAWANWICAWVLTVSACNGRQNPGGLGGAINARCLSIFQWLGHRT